MTNLLDIRTKIFNEELYSTMVEALDQNLEAFTSATQGTFILTSGTMQGYYSEEAYFKRLLGMATRRDVKDDTTDITKRYFEDDSRVKTKTLSRTDNIVFGSHIFDLVNKDPAMAQAMIARQLAEVRFQDHINTGLGALRGALTNNADALYTIPSDGVASFDGLLEGASLFGDMDSKIRVWIMHSKVRKDLRKEGLANGDQLFKYETLNIERDPYGRIFIVTDSPALTTYDSPNRDYYTLGLAPNAVVVEDEGKFRDNVETTNGKNNILDSYQAQWSTLFSIDGYSFNKSAENPTQAELWTGSNWTQKADSIKHTAGVVVKSR